MKCRPVSRVTSAGQRHDSLAFTAVLADVRIDRAGKLGRPRTRPDRVLANKAYSTAKIRDTLRRKRIKATIPQPSNQIKGRISRGKAGGRHPPSTTRSTRTATPSSAPSTGYEHSAQWPPGTTNETSSTAAPSTPPASSSGSPPPPTKIHQTRPSPRGAQAAGRTRRRVARRCDRQAQPGQIVSAWAELYLFPHKLRTLPI